MKTRNFIIVMSIIIVIVISGGVLVILVQEPVIPDDKHDDNDVDISIIIIQPDNSTYIIETGNYTIRWNASDCITDVKIELYNNSDFVETVINKTSNDNKSIWIMHNECGYYLCGTNYTIKISDYYDSNICATSDYFGICIDYSVDDNSADDGGEGCG